MGTLVTVEDVREGGQELDAWRIVRQLKDEHRWHEQCSKGEASARVAERLRTGDVPWEARPPSVRLVPLRRGLGIVYAWQCPRCGRRRRYLYRGLQGWHCRGCLGLRYASQAWPPNPLELLARGRRIGEAIDCQLDVMGHQRVGRPPMRQVTKILGQMARADALFTRANSLIG